MVRRQAGAQSVWQGRTAKIRLPQRGDVPVSSRPPNNWPNYLENLHELQNPRTRHGSRHVPGLSANAADPKQTAQPIKNVVLVHGGFVDGSGWHKVYNILKKDGYNVSIVQNPTTSLADDVAVTRRAIAQQDGPVVLVGHSYGGAVITEAGTDPKVERLVYITAFAPDQGESVQTLIANPPPGAPVPPILPAAGRLPVSRPRQVRRRVRRPMLLPAKPTSWRIPRSSQGVQALGGAMLLRPGSRSRAGT